MQAVKTPFTNMSYTPDVPSSALGANEYNAGQNIETNVRGINSVAGDEYILSQIPGNTIFVTSGFDINGTYWFIVATEQGKWYAIDSAGITDITPSQGIGGVITTSTAFDAPSGTSSSIANTHTYWTVTPTGGSGSGAILQVSIANNNASYAGGNYNIYGVVNGGTLYAQGDVLHISGTQVGGTTPANDITTPISNYATFGTTPGIGNFTGYNSSTVITASWNGGVVFLNDQINPPMYFAPGQWSQIRLYDNLPDNYVWNYDVIVPTSGPQAGNTIPLYSSLTAGFIRVYNSPNLGSLLVSGNLTGTIAANVVTPTPGTIQHLPTTVRWSQNFGLNSGPTTWAPTVTNVANEVEMPVRGPVIDGFPLNGNFYICSYWDTCLMSPIAYQSSYAPVFGIKLVNQGRGLLNENCWANVDNTVFGLDARDIWQFDGGNFKAIGNQRVKTYFYNNLNPSYTNQVFMQHNSAKYQIEIYYPDLTSTGQCNQMIAYRYDLDAWQPPRQVTAATQSTEAPRWTGTDFNLATRGVVYSTFANVATTNNTSLIQKDTGTSFIGNTAINSLFQRNNISYGQPYSASVLVHRVLPEVYGTGNITVTVGGADSVANAVVYSANVTMPIQTSNPWTQINQNESRVVTMQVGANSAVDSWQMTAANWQVTVVQDTR